MDRRERANDAVEATRAALDGKQAEMWTALPGIVESFDPEAITVCVQPAIKGQIEDEGGNSTSVDLPLLTDVPVVFPCGGGFTLTYPITQGDEALVIFACRCIDAWWQSGGTGGTPDERMHDLSDGIAIVGPRSQPRILDPAVDENNVQLRSDDGKANITMMPDYTIRALNPTAEILMAPAGKLQARADAEIKLSAPSIVMEAASISMGGMSGGSAAATIKGDINQEGSHTSTGDQVARGISQTSHTHRGDSGGTTGAPQ